MTEVEASKGVFLQLRKAADYPRWAQEVKIALTKKGLIGYVLDQHPIHDIVHRPAIPAGADETVLRTVRKERQEFSMKDTEAIEIIMTRIAQSIKPVYRDSDDVTARRLWQDLRDRFEIATTTQFGAALETFDKVSLKRSGGSVDKYIENFNTALATLQIASEGARKTAGLEESNQHEFEIGKKVIDAKFINGTKDYDYLASWRNENTRNGKYESLQTMQNTLQYQVQPHQSRNLQSSQVIARASSSFNDCSRCWDNTHTVEDCPVEEDLDYKQLRGIRDKNKKKKQKKALSTAGSKPRTKSKEKKKKQKVASAREDSSEESGSSSTVTFAVVKSAGPRLTRHTWIFDTGAGRHFCNNKRLFKSLHSVAPVKLDQAVGTTVIDRAGDVKIRLSTGHKMLLKNVLYSPKSSCNLMSAGTLRRKSGVYVNTHTNELHDPSKDHKTIGRVIHCNDLLILDVDSGGAPASAAFHLMPSVTANRWHQRLGHAGNSIISKTSKAVIGLEGFDSGHLSTCETCKLSKAQRKVSREPRPTPLEPLDEVHVDTVGPVTPNLNGSTYITILTCARTRMRWARESSTKDQATGFITEFAQKMINMCNKNIKLIFTDGGKEFRNKELIAWARQSGIRTDVSAPYTPEQNGTAEAANKVIVTRARSMLIDAKMPPQFWGLAVQYACYVSNRVCRKMDSDPPLSQFMKELKQPHADKIDVRRLRRFGCRAYVTIPNQTAAHKFLPRADMCWFVGFQENSDTNYLVLQDRPQWKIFYSPHVTFDEDTTWGGWTLSYEQQRLYRHSLPSLPEEARCEPSGDAFLSPAQTGLGKESDEEEVPGDLQEDELKGGDEAQGAIPRPRHQLHGGLVPQQPHAVEELGASPQQHQSTEGLGACQREQTASTDGREEEDSVHTAGGEVLIDHPAADMDESRDCEPILTNQDFTSPAQEIAEEPVSDRPQTTPMEGVQGSLQQGQKRRRQSPGETSVEIRRSGRDVPRADYKRLNKRGRVGAVKPSSDENPKTWQEAMAREDCHEWRKAADAEISSLMKDTFKVINQKDVPQGRTPLTGKWVFNKKMLPNGKIDKYKARWTARGFTQKDGVDYTETFAPTPVPATGRVLQGLAAHYKWKTVQMDVKSAFLNPKIDVQLYIEMPEGYKQPGKMIRLLRGLYGLKQAAALWYDHARMTLSQLGFEPTISDVCLYANEQKDTYVLMHVDDLQIMGSNDAEITRLTEGLQKRYEMSIVKTGLFLNLNVTRSKKFVKLDQSHYVKKLLNEYNLTHVKSMLHPLQELLEENPESATQQDVKSYQKLIGELNYLSNSTRPDISHATNHLARFSSNPSPEHYKAALRVLKYLSGTIDKGLRFKKGLKGHVIEAFTDADFGGDPSTSRSTSGGLITVCKAPVIWRSKLQREAVFSSTEAEYLALSETCREILWLQNLLREIGVKRTDTGAKPMLVNVDNISTIKLATNHVNHRRSKHIAIRNHKARELLQSGKISIDYVETSKQRADCLTKARSNVAIFEKD